MTDAGELLLANRFPYVHVPVTPEGTVTGGSTQPEGTKGATAIVDDHEMDHEIRGGFGPWSTAGRWGLLAQFPADRKSVV